ncbi:MAG: diguanylate cyclase, partial [Piscinibacter sp.]
PAMDQRTLIIVLAIHLVSSGALFWLIGRNMPARSGVGRWALGALMFGLSYAGRWFTPEPPWWLMVALDSAMVAAALLFFTGLLEFVGRPAGRWPLLVGFALAYAAVHALVFEWRGLDGRRVLHNLTLALLFGALALAALRSRGHENRALRAPLAMLAVMMGSLAMLGLARALAMLVMDTGSFYQGALAQIYYGYASLAAVMLGLNLVWLVFSRLTTQLAELAARDPLTRLLNRNGLDEVMARHFAARETRPVTLLQVDIDHFKRINDSHGHAAGDRVLREVASALAASVRASDFIARTGGEEFLVGCVAADDGVARALAERLLAAVRKLDIRVPGAKVPLHCTVSIGISGRCAQKADWERCWAEADRALYAAKAAGRDRVVAASALRADVR